MNVKVLGPGCPNCQKMYQTTLDAVKELGLDVDVEYINDMIEISNYIRSTPGLVVDEKVVHEGKPLPSVAEVKIFLKQAGQPKSGGCSCCGCE